MEKKNIVLFLILIFIMISIIILFYKNESYNVIKPDNTSTLSSSLQQKGMRQGSDALDGLLFEDVNMYESEHNVDGELGLEKCIKKCKGMCVEFGMTGDAYCFPQDYADISKKYTRSIQSEMGFRPL